MPGRCTRPGPQSLRLPALLPWVLLVAGATGLARPVWAQAGVAAPVRFAPEADYGPFVFADAGGQVQGLSIDMLRLVQKHTGLRIEMQPPRALHLILADARERRVDLLSSVRPTPERAAFLDFSVPYVSVPAILVVRAAGAALPEGAGGLQALAGRAVTVGKGYAVESVMRERFPRVGWVAVADDGEALRQLAAGAAEAAVVDAASAAFIVARQGLAGLRQNGELDFVYTLSFGVRKDWPELRQLIDRGIQSISNDERRAVLQRWAPELEAARRTPRAPLATLAALALLVLAALGWAAVWWHRRGRIRP